MSNQIYTLGIDIGSTTVKIAILNEKNEILFSDYERHFANIQGTLQDLFRKAYSELGEITLSPVITGSGGLALANHLGIPFVQEVVAVSTALQDYAPQTDVAIELGGEDAKIIYFEGGNIEQRMNGICAGGTGSFIDQMASLIQTDASGLNEYAKNYKSLYTIAARCGVFAKTDIQPLLNQGARKEDIARVADTLLFFNNIEASFVIGKIDNFLNIGGVDDIDALLEARKCVGLLKKYESQKQISELFIKN